MDDFLTLKPILQARLGKDTYDNELEGLINIPLQWKPVLLTGFLLMDI